MHTRRLVLFAVISLAAVAVAAPAGAQPAQAEAERLAAELRGGTRLQRTRAAIGLRHFVARQSRFTLLGRTEPRWWQVTLGTAAPKLVQMLGDDSGLEWVDQNGVTEQTTSPSKEARLALHALERVAVEPLIAGLDHPKIGPRAAEVLREIAPDGPAGNDPTAWQSFWAERRQHPLARERGRLWQVLLGLLALGLGVASVVLLQSRTARRNEAARRGSHAPSH